MLASIAINETVKYAAFNLIAQGYMQSAKEVFTGPVCGKKYLIFLDQTAYEKNLTIKEAVQTSAPSITSQKGCAKLHDAGTSCPSCP